MENIEVFVQVEGDTRTEILSVSRNASVNDIVRAAAQKGLPVPADGGLVFVEESDEPIKANLSAEQVGIKKHSRVHISRCKKVSVTVHFNAETGKEEFPPSVTVKKVRNWALKEFIKHQRDQVDYVLQLCDCDVRPDLTTQLGALVKEGCKVCFDLVPVQRVEG